ncbi:PREDICTED: transcription initiation factor TFIID subunit 9-like [Colobus angolensis palliatus]|uniref:transcription initiation factor TFIID subunit 9-like n=1 Tax=Colobus angolensis palliatus TaxID=336983 RepID=UPI0005F54C54|nr:PREDICTED: transcription initiation factor TFIID subunit 9-like [Colobus angolensis palliatus]
MESGKMASPKSMPKDAQKMAQILKDMGITEYEPRGINQMMEFAFRYVTTILDDANIYSSHAKKATIEADDVRLAIQCRPDQSFTSPPPRDFLLDIERQRNHTPLPLIKPHSGPRLPPDRYCLTAPNYRLKSLQKKASTSAGRITVPRLSVGSVTSRPSSPILGTPILQTMSVSTKVGTPMSLTSQRFTVQMPTSQSPAVKASIPATSAVQNVLINPSLIGSKSIPITTMVSSQNTASESSNALKRKREDDDDDDDDDDHDYDNL